MRKTVAAWLCVGFGILAAIIGATETGRWAMLSAPLIVGIGAYTLGVERTRKSANRARAAKEKAQADRNYERYLDWRAGRD